MAEEKLRQLVRLANTDINGNIAVGHGLTKIRGIGFMYANMVCMLTHIDSTKKTGLLDSGEIERINDFLANPGKYNVPPWMMNRRLDFETGKNMHLLTGDLGFVVEQDIRRMKKIKSYKGVRHSIGQPVRGQRTKSNFRRNKGKVVGVKKNKDAKAGKT